MRCLLLFALLTPIVRAEMSGEQIYQKKCASCHGANGEGTKRFKPPLTGDRSVPQLSQYIAKTMPEDNPGTCTGPDADKVAKYIHDTFYSVDARERNQPPRVELARLTVRQYRNVVADLVASFRPTTAASEKQGLRGQYYAARNFRNDKRQIDRVDPEVKFDFGTGTPKPGTYEPHEFCAVWEGSISPPESGEYELIVRTEHSTKLFVNDNRVPLIDAWVKSGNDTEFRGTMQLLAGRSYPVRLEFSKSQQGVNNQEKAKQRASLPASVALLWKMPGRSPEVVPSRFLSPAASTNAFVVTTPFPPDDRSRGWERGTAISKAWDQATTDGAFETANYVVGQANELAGTKADAADRTAKLRDFAKKFVERAFRHPLTDAETQLYVSKHFDTASTPDVALKRVILLTLKSPRFLYREPPTGNDPYAIASRLSFGLWDTIPDEELRKAAATGKLATRADVVRHAERMLADPRAKAKLRDFLHTWLKVDHAMDIAKDPKRYPGFDPAIVTDLRSSLDLFLDEVAFSKEADFRRLMTEESLYMNGRLAKYFKAQLPEDSPFTKVTMKDEPRAGVLTHPFMMASLAYTGTSSPIHRGVFLARSVLGTGLKPPQDAFTPLAEDLHPNLTTRERVALQTKPVGCQSCHAVINPLGFTLEHFDAVGRYRITDNGKVVDSSGQHLMKSGEVIKFAGPRDLGKFCATSPEVHATFVEQMFHHLVQQPVRAYGKNTQEELRQEFAKANFDMRRLMIEIVMKSAWRGPT